MTPAAIALADALLGQALQFWAQFQAQKAAGTLTVDDLTAAMAKVDADLSQLAADVEAQGKAAA